MGLAVDVVLGTALYIWYRWVNGSAEEIKKAPVFKPGAKLFEALLATNTGTLAYACVQGEVKAVNRTIPSIYQEGRDGVIQVIKTSEFRDPSLTVTQNTLINHSEFVPFMLTQGTDNVGTNATQILVTEVREANFIMNELTVVYDVITPKNEDALTQTLAWFFGVTKGYQKTEEMLLTNTTLLGIGEIVLMDGQLQLRPPTVGSMYILTKLTKAELIKDMEKKSFLIKLMTVATGVVGACLLVYILQMQFKRWWEKRKMREFLQHAHQQRQIREERQAEINTVNNSGVDNSSSICVVCFNNPREVVLLDCGHVCLCADCVVIMPQPRTCPICRRPVVRYLNAYYP